MIFGILGAAAGGGAGLGPYATAVLHDAQGAYDQAFLIAVVVCAVSIFAMWQAGPRKVRLDPGRVPARAAD